MMYKKHVGRSLILALLIIGGRSENHSAVQERPFENSTGGSGETAPVFSHL